MVKLEASKIIKEVEIWKKMRKYKRNVMATLSRDRDGEGHYGCVLQALDPKDLSNVVGNKPMEGYCFKIGTLTAGTFSNRDWWMTTPVTNILSETDDEIRFETDNSTYTLRK